ncbi:MAG: DHH family phosphoesterase [Candidatus Hodarchaeota archaeon]
MFLSLSNFSNSLQSSLKTKSLDVALASDNDLDGLFSAVKLDLGLYELYETEVETFFREEVRWEVPINDDFDLLIMLDLAYDNTPNYRKAAARAKNVYAIDHHVTNETGFPQRVNVYNPCNEGQCYQPTTYLVDKVVNRLGKSADNHLNVYLNLLGVLADAGINFRAKGRDIEYFYDPELTLLFEKGMKQFNHLFETQQYENFVYPRFKETLEALNLEAEDLGWKELYLRLINEATDFEAVQKIISKIQKKYENSYQELLQQIPREPTELTKSGIWLLKNTTSISNGTIGRVIAELLNQAVITYSCTKFCRVSARAPAESTINFIPLFNSYGGGHPKACGAFLSQNKFQQFYEAMQKF